MPTLYYELALAGIAAVAILLLASLIFPRKTPVLDDPLGYLNEWDPTMEIGRRDFLILQREDAFRAGIDPLSPDYPPLLPEHIAQDGESLKFL